MRGVGTPLGRGGADGETSMLNRRLLLGAAAALPFVPSGAAEARAPFRKNVAPAWYRFRIGEFEATVVSDGSLPLGATGPAFPTAPPEEVSSLLREHFLPPDSATLEQNVLVVNTPTISAPTAYKELKIQLEHQSTISIFHYQI